MTDQLRRNGSLTEMLAGALRDGAHGLGSVPSLLRQVLEEESWREMVTQRGERVFHERFADYVTAPPLAGLGSDVGLVRRIVAEDDTASKLLRKALKGQGRRTDIRNNRTEVGTRTGTTRTYALERLERDAPELHAEVLAGNLSPHAAMVKAGFRRRTVTVPVDSPESAASALRKHLKPEQLSTLARLLLEG